MRRRALSRGEITFLVGVPLAWAVLLLFHPRGDGTQVYEDARDQVTAMLAVHVGMMLFIPLIAIAIYVLLRGVEGTAARVSRIALLPFVVFYGVWEALQGIANGVLVDKVNGLPPAERETGANLVQDFAESPLVRDFGVFATPGAIALVTATIAAAVALRRHAGAPASVAALLGVSGLFITAHPPPFGPLGLVIFIAAVLLFARSQGAARAAGPLPNAGPA